MTSITTFMVSIDRKQLLVTLDIDPLFPVETFKIADEVQYLNDTSTNLASKIAELNLNETVTLVPSDLGVSSFDGIYFLTITCTGQTEKIEAVTTSITQYFYCINDLLANANTDCVECNDGLKNVLTADLFLEGLKSSLYLGRYSEAIKHFNSLNRICTDCCETCGTSGGVVFGVVNGNIMLG